MFRYWDDEPFDRERIEAWSDDVHATLEGQVDLQDSASTAPAAETCRQLALTLFRAHGIRTTIHGIHGVYPDPDIGKTADESDWETLREYNFSTNLEAYSRDYGSLTKEFRDIITAGAAYESIPILLQRAEDVRAIIYAKYEQNATTYGNKYAGLVASKEIAVALNEYFGEELYTVPAFTGIEAARFAKDAPTEHALKEELAWAKTNAPDGCWVRSSAVYGEDASKTTGAGVYESEFVPDINDHQAFIDAVKKVLASAESELGVRHREDHGIVKESMGVVLQKAIPVDDGNRWGYANSQTPGVPDLQEVYVTSEHSETGAIRSIRMPFWKNIALLEVAQPPYTIHGRLWWNDQISMTKAPYFKFDSRAVWPRDFLQAAYLSIFSEAVLGQAVQQEFISGNKLNILQTRTLPESFFSVDEIFHGFPDRQALYHGRALGIANGIIGRPIALEEVLREQNNSEGPIIAVAESNFCQGAIEMRTLGRAKAVVVVSEEILTRAGAAGAHIETLCAENGIPCSFATQYEPGYTDPFAAQQVFRRLLAAKRLGIWMDGLESRVYEVE